MDSITQLVAGGVIGERILGEKLGNKAVLWGAIVGTIPDLDVFLSPFYNTVDNLFLHRGFSHSLLFCLLASPLLALLLHKIYSNKKIPLKKWWIFNLFVLFGAVFIDYLTGYGASILWPFSDYRIELQTISIVDVFFTLPLIVLLLIILFKKLETRNKLSRIAIYFGVIYLAFTGLNKIFINRVYKTQLKLKNIEYRSLMTTPMPLTNFLWTGIAKTDRGYYIGTYSWFDKDQIEFRYIASNESLLNPYKNNFQLRKLLNFTKGYYQVQQIGDHIVIHDLRFGQFGIGENAEFVFSFKLKDTSNGVIIEEKERDFELTNADFRKYVNRIAGRK